MEGKLQAPQNVSWFYEGFIFQSGMQVFFDIGLEKLPKFTEGCCEWVERSVPLSQLVFPGLPRSM
jgi:hypothetical protein